MHTIILSFVSENGTIPKLNYQGFPLNNYGGKNFYQEVSVEECQYLCEITDQCQYFNYNIDENSFSNTCFLKYGVGRKEDFNGLFGHKYSPGNKLIILLNHRHSI